MAINNKLDNYLFDDEYKKKYQAFEKANGDAFLTSANIANFQNDYLRKKHVINCDEMKVRAARGKEITLTKDNFNQAFLSSVWNKLDFSKRYTLLHWLQSTLSNKENLPTIDFISPYVNGRYKGAYFHATNSIYLDYSILNSGIDSARILIHEMDHFNNFYNRTEKSVVQVKDNKISLRKYLKTKYSKRKAIDINLFETNSSDWQKVLFFKNMLSPIVTTATRRNEVDSLNKFKQYMYNELYIYSPMERKAFMQESKHLNTMMENQPVRGFDRIKLDAVNRHSYNVESLRVAPILNKLDQSSKDLLLDKTMQTDYYFYNQLCMSPSYMDYTQKQDTMYLDIYNHFRKENGELDLEK